MSLSADDAARLASLQGAYDKLIKGEATASVMSGGRRVDYAAGDKQKVKDEIDRLNAAASAPRGRTRGALGFRIL